MKNINKKKIQYKVILVSMLVLIGCIGLSSMDCNGNALENAKASSLEDVNVQGQIQAHAVIPSNMEPNTKKMMYLIGGHDGSKQLNDVWSSEDGATWKKILDHSDTPKANQFRARTEHATIVHKGQMYTP